MVLRCLAMMRGGGETRHLAWIRELRAMGIDVDVIAGRPLVARARYADPDPNVATLRSPYVRDLVYRLQGTRGLGRATSLALHLDEEWFCRAAWRRIAATKPDVVHAHALHQMARLRTMSVPVVVNLPGPPHRRYLADLRRADALVSDGWGARHLPSLVGRPVDAVPKGVDTAQFSPEGPNRRAALGLVDVPTIVAVSRLVPIKNVALLLDAVAAMRRSGRRAAAIVVGEGPEDATLRARASRLGIADAVTFAGGVPHHETPAWYRTGDVFALTSDFDNSPNVVLEAMASGLPVVATDVGGVAEFVVDRERGRLVPPRDVDALADALWTFLADRASARQVGAANRAVALRDFSWRRSARRLLDVYERVAA